MRQDNAWSQDIKIMHKQFGTQEWVSDNPDKLNDLLKLRMRMLSEEFNETLSAYLQNDNEEFIDGLIDLCVIAIGTLDIAGVDSQRAWSQVLEANLSKSVGVKPSRPNPLGLPDLVKPVDWVAPDHSDNHGNL